jgi:hypothetical protein
MTFLLGSSATFYLTQVTLKNLHFVEITDIPLAFVLPTYSIASIQIGIHI